MPEVSKQQAQTPESTGERSDSSATGGGTVVPTPSLSTVRWVISHVPSNGGRVVEHRPTRYDAMRLTDTLFDFGAQEVTIRRTEIPKQLPEPKKKAVAGDPCPVCGTPLRRMADGSGECISDHK